MSLFEIGIPAYEYRIEVSDDGFHATPLVSPSLTSDFVLQRLEATFAHEALTRFKTIT